MDMHGVSVPHFAASGRTTSALAVIAVFTLQALYVAAEVKPCRSF